MRNRNEHLEWCKERALDYVDLDDTQQAFASMASDLRKHEKTRDHPGIELGMGLLVGGHLDSQSAMREFIEGFQ